MAPARDGLFDTAADVANNPLRGDQSLTAPLRYGSFARLGSAVVAPQLRITSLFRNRQDRAFRVQRSISRDEGRWAAIGVCLRLFFRRRRCAPLFNQGGDAIIEVAAIEVCFLAHGLELRLAFAPPARHLNKA